MDREDQIIASFVNRLTKEQTENLIYKIDNDKRINLSVDPEKLYQVCWIKLNSEQQLVI